MSVGSGQATADSAKASVPAHDPIAIAALVAELPELEAKFAAAMKTAEEANKALDVIQDRIDQAIKALKSKAPRGSKWNTAPKREISPQDLQQLYAQIQGSQNAAGNGNNAMNQMMNQNAVLAQQIERYESQRIKGVAAPPPPLVDRWKGVGP